MRLALLPKVIILTLLLYLKPVWEFYKGEDWTERETARAVPLLWGAVGV